MKVRFENDLAGPERILAMVNAVVDEITLALDSAAKVPLIPCGPEAGLSTAVSFHPSLFPLQ